MNNCKITLRLLINNSIFPNENFLEKNSNMLINNGNDLTIDINQSLLSSRSNNNIKCSNISLNSNNNILKNIDVKNIISKTINNPLIKPENLILFINNEDKYLMLHDKNIFPFLNPNQNEGFIVNNSSVLNSEMRNTDLQNIKNSHSLQSTLNTPNNIIYYKLCNILQPIIIDIYQFKIDKINLNLPISCSIFMLKYLIFKNLHLNINELEKNFKIYGTGFSDKKGNVIKALTNRKFDENTLIFEICNYYNLNNNKILNLIMIEKSSNQCGIGLNFNFNCLKNFQISNNFENDKKNFRCVLNGLNLYIYCMNSSCKIFNKYFIINKAYGVFDIFPCLSQIICPFCYKKKIILKNIGMINSKWNYKGYLKHSKISKINGDGLTILNNKLYKINEINFEEQFHSLLFEVEFYQSKLQKKQKYSTYNKNKKNDFKKGEDDNNLDFNDINLEQRYLTKSQNGTINVTREFTFQKNNKSTYCIYPNRSFHKNDKEIIDLFQKKNLKSLNNISPSLNLIKDKDFKIKIDNQKEQCCNDCSTFSSEACFIW